MSTYLKYRDNNEVPRVQNHSDVHACGDQLSHSESGVELKSLLKLIDNVIEMSPATDEEEPNHRPSYHSNVIEKSNPFGMSAPRPARFAPSKFESQNHNQNQNHHHIKRGSGGGDGKVTLSETLMVPVKQFPKYNFVGRILGPRGMTVKQLEKETGCRIFVRGRGSSTAFNPHTKSTRLPFNSKNTLSTISQGALTAEPLHVYIESNDFPVPAQKKLAHAVTVITELLSPPADGKDELKRQQLVDISLINGTYRATSSTQDILRPLRHFGQTIDPTSNPADLDVQPLNFDFASIGLGGDTGPVYGIAQQRRAWQKPRGPDSSSLEYAKSVSSREFVTDIVNKTKKSPVRNGSDDSSYNLPQSVVSETLKVAKTLLASHQHLTFAPKIQSRLSTEYDDYTANPIDNKTISGDGDGTMKTVWRKEMCPQTPPSLMSSLFPPPQFQTDFYPPPTASFSDYQVPHNGLYYMLPPHPTSFSPSRRF